MMTKRDLYNVQRDFNIFEGRHHASDYVSVKLWIQKMTDLPSEDNPLVYHMY